MSKITDDIEFNIKMSELAAKQHELMLKSINSALSQFTNTLSQIITPITEIAQLSMPNSLQLYIDKLNEIHQIYQPIIDSAFLHIDEFVPKFDSLLINLSNSLKQINYEEYSEEEKKELSTVIESIEEVKTTITTHQLSISDWISIIGILLPILIGLLPNSQLEQIHEDNKVIIQQNNEEAKRDQQIIDGINLINEFLQKYNETIQTLPLEVPEEDSGDCEIPD